jgi:hypothetical protein
MVNAILIATSQWAGQSIANLKKFIAPANIPATPTTILDPLLILFTGLPVR